MWNSAESELEGKRDELRSKLLSDLEDKKKALEVPVIPGNVIENFEAKAHFTRRLRDRKPNSDAASDQAASSPVPVIFFPWILRPPV